MCPASPTARGVMAKGRGIPRDGPCRERAVPIPAASPASQAGWESPGGVSGAAPSSAFSRGSSRAAFGRGSWAKPRAPYTVNQAVQVGSQPKPERKGKKWVSFLELCLAPAETEGPMILHHFAFSLPPLTQAVPRTGCALPGPARARRMPEQELLSHEDAVGSPCSHLHCPAGSCSLAAAPQRVCSPGREAWKARAQGLLPVLVPMPRCQPCTSREHSPSLTALRAAAKRLLLSRLFSQCTQAGRAQQWHCQGWWRVFTMAQFRVEAHLAGHPHSPPRLL